MREREGSKIDCGTAPGRVQGNNNFVNLCKACIILKENQDSLTTRSESGKSFRNSRLNSPKTCFRRKARSKGAGGVFDGGRKAAGGNEAERILRRAGQAGKSARGMPWHQEPTKDVTSCEKPRGGANIHRSGDLRMGQPGGAIRRHPALNKIGVGREPPELKHLSRARKRHQPRFRK